MAQAVEAAEPRAADAGASDVPDAAAATALPSARMVVSEATIEVRAGEPDSVATAAARVVSESGGYVARSEADRVCQGSLKGSFEASWR